MRAARQTSEATATPEQDLQTLQTRFEDYLKLDQDEVEEENRTFLNHLSNGKIQINFEHLVLATKRGHLGLLTGIFLQLDHIKKIKTLSKDAKGFTLLHHLAKIDDPRLRLKNDKQKIVQLANLFLKNRVHINALTNQGRNTALILAIKYKNTALFSALIAKNARLETDSSIIHPLAHINHYNAMNKNALDYVMETLEEEVSEEKKQQIKTDYLIPLLRSGVDIVDYSKPFKQDDLTLKATTIIKLIIEHEENLSKVLKDAEEIFYTTDLKLSDEEVLERLEKFNMKYNLLYALSNFSNGILFVSLSPNHELEAVPHNYREFCTKLPTILVENGVTKEDQKNFTQFLERYCYNDLEVMKYGITDNVDIDKIKYSFFCKYDQVSIDLVTSVLITFLEATTKSRISPEIIGKFSDPEYDKFNYLPFIYRVCRGDTELYKEIIETSIENGFNPFSFGEDSEQSRTLLDIQMSLGSIIASKYNNGRFVLTLDHTDFSGDSMIQSHKEGTINKTREYLTMLFRKDATEIEGVKEISFYFYTQSDPRNFFKNIFYFLIAMNEGSKTIIRDNPNVSTFAHKTSDGSIPISIYRDEQMFYHSSYGFINYHGEVDEMLKPSSGVMRFNFNLDKQELEDINKRYSFPIKTSLQYDVYIGSFKDGLFHGDGFLKFSDGTYYQGSFKKGLFDGQGKIVHPDGKFYEVIFKKGKLLVDLKKEQRVVDFITENGLRLGILPGNRLVIQTRGVNNVITSRILENVTLAKEISKKDSSATVGRGSAGEDQIPKIPKSLAKFIAESFNNFLEGSIDDRLNEITEFHQLKLELEKLEKGFGIISETITTLSSQKTPEALSRITESIELQRQKLQIYRQRIYEIRYFFKTAKADLLQTIQIENSRSKLSYDQFQELIGLDSLIGKFQFLKSTQEIVIDNENPNLITPFVQSLESRLISTITTKATLTTIEQQQIKQKISELYSLIIDQAKYQEIEETSKDLLSETILPISPSPAEQYMTYTTPTKEKTKTTASVTTLELIWNRLVAGKLKITDEQLRLMREELLTTEEKPDNSPRIVTDFSLSELSDLSKLLNGIDLETVVSTSSTHQVRGYSSLDDFRSGCAPETSSGKSKRELQAEFHQLLENLVQDITETESYNSEEERASLTSHIYNLNAYCIGGENWKEYVLRNYERLSVQGRLIGLTAGLGHASNANENELNQMIWTVSQLQQIHDIYKKSIKEAPAKTINPLSIRKFQDHLSTIFSPKPLQTTTQSFEGKTSIIQSSDRDYLQNLVDYFLSIADQDLKPPLNLIKEKLNEFIKTNLTTIDQDQGSSFAKEFKECVRNLLTKIENTPKIDLIKEIRDSEFDLIAPIIELAKKNQSITELRDFCKLKYQDIHTQYEDTEKEKSRQGQVRSLAGVRSSGLNALNT